MSKMRVRKKDGACPLVTENPAWVALPSVEIENMVVKMAKDGNNSAVIGLMLRDQYGVPDVKLATGRTVTAIMKENGVASALPEDLSNLMRRAINLNTHLKENHGDVSSKRGLMLIESKIRRLERYYKMNKILLEDWKYSLSTAELMLK